MIRNSGKYRKIAFETYGLRAECEKCGEAEKRLDVHHIDEDYENNTKNNLQILCISCHTSHHRKGTTMSDESKEKISKNSAKYWLGKKLSKETKDKLSLNARKYRKGKTGKDHNCSKKIEQTTLDGELIKIWDSLMDLQRDGQHRGYIGECCQGKRESYKGYIWKYLT